MSDTSEAAGERASAWCQIIDGIVQLAHDGDCIFDWNSYEDRCGIVSIPSYLETHADRFRARLITLLNDIGSISVGGKSVRDHLEINDGFSIWSMSLIVEKSPFKSPRIFDCLRILALEELLSDKKPAGVEVVTPDKHMATAVQRLCKELNICFRWRKLGNSVVATPQSFLRRIYRFLPRLFQAIFWLAAYVIGSWTLRRARTYLPVTAQGDITVFSYLIHVDKESCSHGNFKSRQWGRVSELLNSASQCTNWFHHYIESPEVPDKRTAIRWLASFNLDIAKQGQHCFIDSFIHVGSVLRVIRRLLSLKRVALRLQRIEPSLSEIGFPTWLWPFIEEDFQESICGQAAAQNLVWIELFEAVVSSLPKQRLGLYLAENQGWERAMIFAWKKYGHGELIGVAHATIRYWDIRYFEDPRIFNDTQPFPIPAPDKLAVNGVVARSAMAEFGYPEDRLVEVEAQRYFGFGDLLYGKVSGLSYAAAEIPPNPIPKKRLIVLGDLQATSTTAMMTILQKCAAELESKFDITVRPHPAHQISMEDFVPLVYRVTHEPLPCILGQYDIALVANATSASLDALLCGLSVLTHLSAGEINLSPLCGVAGARFFSNSTDLMCALSDAIGGQSTHLVNDYFWLDPSMPRWLALVKHSLDSPPLLSGSTGQHHGYKTSLRLTPNCSIV